MISQNKIAVQIAKDETSKLLTEIGESVLPIGEHRDDIRDSIFSAVIEAQRRMVLAMAEWAGNVPDGID